MFCENSLKKMKKKNSQIVERWFLDTIVKHGTLDGTCDFPVLNNTELSLDISSGTPGCAGSEPASTSIPSATPSA